MNKIGEGQTRSGTTDPSEIPLRRFVYLALIITIACVAFALVMMSVEFGQPAGPGIFGDMFGALNAWFSGLAFAGVIYAILLQRTELRLQREELEQTREELRRTAQAQEHVENEMRVQNRHLQRQLVNNQFFQLLHEYHEMVRHTQHKNYEGPHAIRQIRDVLYRVLSDTRAGRQGVPPQEVIEDAYERFYVDFNAAETLGHIFRTLYHIVRFVHDQRNTLTWAEKYRLIQIIRSQLSESLLNILFYNGLSRHGKKFFELIDGYDLLQNFSFRDVPQAQVQLYPQTWHRNHFPPDQPRWKEDDVSEIPMR